MSDIEASPLHDAASSLAAEIRGGRWSHVAELESQPPATCEEIIAELRSRCPGHERTEYEAAIARGLAEYRPAPASDVLAFWLVGMTFIWALPIGSGIMRGFVSRTGGEWVGLCAYPTICGIAAFFLATRKRRGRFILAALNVVAGVTWIGFVIWALRAFVQGFWR